jgi:glycosyltransferase involved in cell wall biosynthesis
MQPAVKIPKAQATNINERDAKPADVIINGRFLTQGVTGVQRVALGLCGAIDDILTDTDPQDRPAVEIYVPRPVKLSMPWRTIRIRHVPGGRGYWWEQVTLPRAAAGRLIVNFCSLAPVIAPGLVCIHDANIFTVPDNFSWQFRWAYRILLPLIGRRAKRIVTVSHYSANQLVAHGVTAAEHITMIPAAVDHIRHSDPRRSRLETSKLPNTFIFAIGTMSDNKNLKILLSIASQLQKDGIGLVIAGDINEKVFASGDTLLSKDLTNTVVLGRIDDDDLPLLYRRALCLAFPSIEEGFGLPPLEAMNCGCPVIASNRASLPEVCGDAALLCSPFDPDQWLAAIRRLAADSSLRASMIERGRAQAARYSFAVSAKAWLALIKEELTSAQHQSHAYSKIKRIANKDGLGK